MEIHKPHAAKTWREFAVELATITAGILIALTLDSASGRPLPDPIWIGHPTDFSMRDS